MKEKVVIGMSGGVDSSVAAYLLKEQGYDVVGVTMKTWREPAPESPDSASSGFDTEGNEKEDSAVSDAARIAEKLGIPHVVLDFSNEFYEKVVCPFMDEYVAGRTPNPCILCNRHMKWAALIEYADSIGAKYIATGHYASIVKLPNGRLSIQQADTLAKDQAYALYQLTQEQLARTLMPVGAYSKDEIRSIAEKFDQKIAEKHDSQEICFIPDKDYGAFLSRQSKKELPPAGNFVDREGHVLGRHKGIHHYTIGQRKGLDLAMGHPVYVLALRPDTNEVVLGENEDLFFNTVRAHSVQMMGVESIDTPLRAVGKIRYGHKGSACTVSFEAPDTLIIAFDEPQRAITPGQAVVIYKDGAILCGGIIE